MTRRSRSIAIALAVMLALLAEGGAIAADRSASRDRAAAVRDRATDAPTRPCGVRERRPVRTRPGSAGSHGSPGRDDPHRLPALPAHRSIAAVARARSWRSRAGPGYSTINGDFYYHQLYRPLLRRRSLLLVDLRGTGASGAIECRPLQTMSPTRRKAWIARGRQMRAFARLGLVVVHDRPGRRRSRAGAGRAGHGRHRPVRRFLRDLLRAVVRDQASGPAPVAGAGLGLSRGRSRPMGDGLARQHPGVDAAGLFPRRCVCGAAWRSHRAAPATHRHRAEEPIVGRAPDGAGVVGRAVDRPATR